MRKLFRMQFESCSGQCYDHSDVMRIHTLGLDVKGAVEFLKRLLAMHAPSCGNLNLAFRLDVDEFGREGDGACVMDQRFVASFYRYGALDLFADDTALGAMNKLIDGALTWYRSEEAEKYGVFAMGNAAHGSVCHHGTDEKLVSFALTFSGLNEQDQAAVRAQL